MEVTLFTFPSTYYALRAEKLMQEAGLAARLIPVPRALSSSCGLALEIATADEEAAMVILGANVKLERKAHVVKQKNIVKDILEIVEFGGWSS